MDVIIDAYNLIGFQKGLQGALEHKRNWLLQQLAAYQKLKNLSIVVVFDGWRAGALRETEEKRNGLRILYSRLGEKADALIVRIAREKGSGCVVITSDREIRRSIGRFGAVAIHAEEFDRILREIDRRSGNDPFDSIEAGEGTYANSNRLSKSERNRLERLRKLRID